MPDQVVVSVRMVAFGADGAYVQLDDGRIRRLTNAAIRVTRMEGQRVWPQLEAANSTCWKANGIRGRTQVGGACVPCTPCSGPGWVENTAYCSNPEDQDECGCCFRDNSPIFIDMGGPGFPFSDAQDGVLFETNAAGTVRRLAWPLRPVEEPWLAWDRNGNGEIDSFVELFGNVTPLANGTISNHGYELLAELDEDGNGRVDRADDGFKYLQLWRDENRNGISEPDELQPLTDSPVEGLSTSFRKSALEDKAGNRFKFGSTAKFVRGPMRSTWDVFLASQAP